MAIHEEEVLPKVEKLEAPARTTPVLKSVNCIYVPASDPYRTIMWFGRYFGLHRKKPVDPNTTGESLALGNGMALFILRAEKGSRMTFRTDYWAGANFEKDMLSFEVDDIDTLHRTLMEEGAHVEELRDQDGCGMGFYFYDPDGNKFSAWELQTLVRHKNTESSNWKERFKLDNGGFNGDLDTFLEMAAKVAPGASRRVKIVGHAKMRESDPEGLNELLGTFEQFNRQYPQHSLRVVYRE